MQAVKRDVRMTNQPTTTISVWQTGKKEHVRYYTATADCSLISDRLA